MIAFCVFNRTGSVMAVFRHSSDAEEYMEQRIQKELERADLFGRRPADVLTPSHIAKTIMPERFWAGKDPETTKGERLH